MFVKTNLNEAKVFTWDRDWGGRRGGEASEARNQHKGFEHLREISFSTLFQHMRVYIAKREKKKKLRRQVDNVIMSF